MRQLLLRVFTPLLPAEPRRVAELARELGDARREGRTPRIDASRGPLEKAVVLKTVHGMEKRIIWRRAVHSQEEG